MKKFISTFVMLSTFVSASVAQSVIEKPINTISSTLQGGASLIQNSAYLVQDVAPDFSASLLSVSTAVGYESQYMFRGEKFAGHSIQPKIEFAYPIYGFDIYLGAWANTPIEGSKGGLTEIDLYGGVNYYYKSLRVDVGYIYYYYTDTDLTRNNLSRDMEVYVGTAFDTSAYLDGINLNPSIYYFYNWILQQNVVEISIGYAIPVGEWVLDDGRLSLPINIYGGYLTADRKNGDNGMPKEDVSYFYWGASADVAFAITDYCTISAGVRFSMREGGNEGDPNQDYRLLGRENNVWAGAKVEFGF